MTPLAATEAERLKPCLHCGSADVKFSNPGEDDNSYDFVICNGCGISISRADCDAEQEPRDVWNRRASQQSAAQTTAEPCHHRIADARNPIVMSGYICIDCGALFSAADHDGERKATAEPATTDAERADVLERANDRLCERLVMLQKYVRHEDQMRFEKEWEDFMKAEGGISVTVAAPDRAPSTDSEDTGARPVKFKFTGWPNGATRARVSVTGHEPFMIYKDGFEPEVQASACNALGIPLPKGNKS